MFLLVRTGRTFRAYSGKIGNNYNAINCAVQLTFICAITPLIRAFFVITDLILVSYVACSVFRYFAVLFQLFTKREIFVCDTSILVPCNHLERFR